MKKQDINGVRTAQDLERKYDLKNLLILKENYETQKDELNKVENELQNFVLITTNNLKELQDQVDGNITTWFFNGVPTLSNEPAISWDTNKEKNNHLGDLYYDQNTGYSYRFSLADDVYSWVKLTDSDITKALAIANSAKDTADSKRRVFVIQPTPPYDVGDLWIKDEEIYRCQTSVASGNFSENDWIKAVKYTDDTVANRVADDLTVLSGSVLEIKNNVDEHTVKITQTTELVNEQGEKVGLLEQNTSTMQQTVNEYRIELDSLNKQNEEFLITLDGITNAVTKIGGGNLIKDSLGALNDGSWTGDVLSIRDTYTLSNSIAGQGIMLNNGTIEQQIQLPNEVHTLSFKYKKLLSTPNVKLYVNDTVFILDELNTTEFVQQINVTNNTLNIKFESDSNNACYILDLVLNLGSTKDVWTQNANETTTDTVKIGKGIQVDSSTTNTYWRADSDGSRVFNKTTNEVVQEATDKGTKTKQLESTDTSIINGVLFTKVGSQRWISGV